MRKILLGIAVLLPLATVDCTSTPAADLTAAQPAPHINMMQPVQDRGYILTASNDDEAAIRNLYAGYGVLILRALGNHQYELHLQHDPSLAEMNRIAAHSGGVITAVQPNFSYSVN